MTEWQRPVITAGDYQVGKRYTSSRSAGAWWLAMLIALLVGYLFGLFTYEWVESGRPKINPATDPGFVNVEGHEGEVLVVGTGGQLRWTTEAELHEAAGHG